MIRNHLAEVVGTFSLVFAGTSAIVVNDISAGAVTHVGVSLTFGFIVMSMIYALGDVSGAHLNPAVTIGFWLARRISIRVVFPYVGCQLAGAFLASAIVKLLFWDHPTLGATLPFGSYLQSFILESILTAILMMVVLCVSSGPKEQGALAGIAIGGVIAVEALFAGPISGASMNPARSVSPAVLSGRIDELWIYIVAPVLGASIGAYVSELIKPMRRSDL